MRGLRLTLLAAALVTGTGCSRDQRALFFDLPPEPEPAAQATAVPRDAGTADAATAPRSAPGPATATREPAEGREPPPAVESLRLWDEVLESLPQTEGGEADWVAARRRGNIRPRADLPGGRTPTPASFGFDFFLPGPEPDYDAWFPHSTHTETIACASCHPRIFRRRGAPITMESIEEGRHCGACHGTVAFGTGECARCHLAMAEPEEPEPSSAEAAPEPERPPGILGARDWAEALEALPLGEDDAPDWIAAAAQGVFTAAPGIEPDAEPEEVLDLDVERTPADDPSMKVVFRHATHTELLACDSCHDGLFEMSAGETPITMEAIDEGRQCGACHGTVAFAADACARCHAAME